MPASATTLPASLGAALANKKHGRFTVAFGGDGDFMFVPGHAVDGGAPPDPDALHRPQQPRLSSGIHVSDRPWRRGTAAASTSMDIGTTLKDPNIDYATVARGLGVHGEGPITDPKELAPALKRALSPWSRAARPAVVDVVTDPR